MIKLLIGSNLVSVCSHIVNHDLIDLNLLVNPSDHDTLIYRLICPSNIVTVKIHIQIIHVLYIRKWLKYINIIYVKSMFRKSDATFLKELCSKDHGMHEHVLSFMEMLHITPGEHFIYRESMFIAHHLAAFFSHLLIYKIGDQHIQNLFTARKAAQSFQYLHIRFFLHPVITVYYLKINTGCVLYTCIDS